MNDLFYFNMPGKPVVSAQPVRVKQPSVYLTHANRLPKFVGHCVYIHRRCTDGSVFYVGMGSRQRSMATCNRNAFWTEVYQSHGRTVQIVEVFPTHEEARDAEVEIIDLLRQMGVTLANCSGGGEGRLMRTEEDLADALARSKTIMVEMERARAERVAALTKPQSLPEQVTPKVCAYDSVVQRLSHRYSAADLLAGIERLAKARERAAEASKVARERKHKG